MKKDATTFPRFLFFGCLLKWLYKVSNYGRVKSVKKQLVLKTSGSGNRYKTVALCNGMRKTFRLHRLVAAAFIPLQCWKPDITAKFTNGCIIRVRNKKTPGVINQYAPGEFYAVTESDIG